VAAAEAAKALGVKIYTIAVGVRGEAPMPVKDEFGNEQVVMAKVDVDEKTLQEVSALTGGSFYRATDTDSLKKIYEQINRLEKSKQPQQHFEHARDVFSWALFPALALLGLGFGLEHTRFRRVP
jgi:Ca-activated chloride channel family protein